MATRDSATEGGQHGVAGALAVFCQCGQSVMQDNRSALGKVRAGRRAEDAARLENGGAGGLFALLSFANNMTAQE